MATAANDSIHPSEGLLGAETWWRDQYDWLLQQGYKLRPRYAPDWKPSWAGTGESNFDFEDGCPLPFVQVNDATQISTGERVALKMWFRIHNPLEEEILSYLSTEENRKDKRNNCVCLIDVLSPPDVGSYEGVKIFVMPQLRPFTSPPFDTVGEVIACIKQLLEGLQFLHEHHIAHRDLCGNNFLMEWKHLCPGGYHPARDTRKPDLSAPAKFYTRTQRPPRYFIIDFGLSRQYPPGETSPLEDIILGGDKSVPEFQDSGDPQNPFHTDIYYAGNIIRRDFFGTDPFTNRTMGYRGLDFLHPLVKKMIQDDPKKRPTIDEAVKEFNELVNGLSSWKLRSRTPSRRANIFKDFAHFLGHWKRRAGYIITRRDPIPNPQ
ncbi:hypothetical protein D9613_009144 [Agrocybe pediades]|uniref:Protein kinase domain-containing protein n=1 Tax=Agrocybe pediades TaxID=84607 RepID=A0A8H4R361_9AGAR|nr:hypothetical protein D9613_009144 [Agrocybe pediades]